MNRNIPEHQAFSYVEKESFIISQLIYVNDEGAHKKAISIKIEFIDPQLKGTNTSSLEAQTPGSILFKHIETNKILKNFDIIYTKSEVNKGKIAHWYKILNTVDEYDDNTLQVLEFSEPASYSYSFVLSAMDPNGVSESDRIYFGNRTEAGS